MYSVITRTAAYQSPLVSRGLRYDPLRTLDGSLFIDEDGNVLYSITATYRSVMSKDSFMATNI